MPARRRRAQSRSDVESCRQIVNLMRYNQQLERIHLRKVRMSTHACMHITKDLETRTRSHKIPNKTNKTWIVLSCQLLSPVDFICLRHALFTHEAASSSFQVRRRVSCWPSRVQTRQPASFPEQPVPLGHCLLLGVVHRRCLLHELKQRKLVF